MNARETLERRIDELCRENEQLRHGEKAVKLQAPYLR